MLAPPKPELARAMAENPGAVIEEAAKQHGVTPRAVVEALPEAMRRFAPAASFVDAMGDIAGWGDVTLIVHTDDGIMEFTGAIPQGQVGRGYFNLMGSKGFHGHLRHERCGGLAFVERPFMGKLSVADRVLQRRRRHHVQGVRRPRREARAQGRPGRGLPRARGPDLRELTRSSCPPHPLSSAKQQNEGGAAMNGLTSTCAQRARQTFPSHRAQPRLGSARAWRYREREKPGRNDADPHSRPGTRQGRRGAACRHASCSIGTPAATGSRSCSCIPRPAAR